MQDLSLVKYRSWNRNHAVEETGEHPPSTRSSSAPTSFPRTSHDLQKPNLVNWCCKKTFDPKSLTNQHACIDATTYLTNVQSTTAHTVRWNTKGCLFRNICHIPVSASARSSQAAGFFLTHPLYSLVSLHACYIAQLASELKANTREKKGLASPGQ